jgi:hypothetical protein
MRTFVALMAGAAIMSVAVPASAEPPSTDPHEPVYAEFPPRFNAQGAHKHLPFVHGTRFYRRPEMLVHDVSVDAQEHSTDATYAVDAESVVTRLPGETVIVEPDGRTWHFKPTVTVDRNTAAWRYAVVRRGYPVPGYLLAKQPDVELP